MTAPSRAGARPSGFSPTRTRAGPSLICCWIRAAPGKPTSFAPPLLDRPDQTRLDRRGRRVDIVAVQAKASLEAQGIARSEPDRADLRVGEQRPPEGDRSVGLDRNLKAVLARVTGTGDVAIQARHAHLPGRHEGHVGGLRRELGHHLDGFRTLKGDERPIVGAPQRDALRQARLDMRVVRVLHGGVDDQHQRSGIGLAAERLTIRSSRMPPLSSRSCE